MVESIKEQIDNLLIVMSYSTELLRGKINFNTYKRRMKLLWDLILNR